MSLFTKTLNAQRLPSLHSRYEAHTRREEEKSDVRKDTPLGSGLYTRLHTSLRLVERLEAAHNDAWEAANKKLHPPHAHVEAFNKPLYESNPFQQGVLGILGNLPTHLEILLPFAAAGASLIAQHTPYKGSAREAIEATHGVGRQSFWHYARFTNAQNFKHLKSINTWGLRIFSGLCLVDAANTYRRAYQRSKKQTDDPTYANAQALASATGEFGYQWFVQMALPVAFLQSIIHKPLQAADAQARKLINPTQFEANKDWRSITQITKSMVGRNVALAALASAASFSFVFTVKRYLDPAMFQFFNDSVITYVNRTLQKTRPDSYAKQHQALVAEQQQQEEKPSTKLINKIYQRSIKETESVIPAKAGMTKRFTSATPGAGLGVGAGRISPRYRLQSEGVLPP